MLSILLTIALLVFLSPLIAAAAMILLAIPIVTFNRICERNMPKEEIKKY